MPTNTPPPYFPQNSLQPPDPNRWRKIKGAFFGCLALVVLVVVAIVAWLIAHYR